DPTEVEIDELRKLVPSASLGLGEFEPRKRHPRTLEEALASTVSADVLSRLPKSFDVVGDISLPAPDSELAAYQTIIADAIRVVDMFAGVGACSILIAKKVGDVRVDAIDAKPQAIELLQENVRANKVEAKVHVHLGNAREVIRKELTQIASRVIMNHPSASKEFIKEACDALRPSGGVIHYYTFAGENWEADSRHEFEHEVQASGYVAERVLGIHRVREVAPVRWQVAVDLKVVPRQ